ncbi:MAG: FMN-binding protein [Treponema sp.]|jgi:hypothetical protein|nr:FMN-binding protein [Treponema sp.]
MMKKMPRLLAAVLAGAAAVGCGGLRGTVSGEARDNEGRPESRHLGWGNGYRGPIHVRVLAEDGIILDVEVLSHREDPFVGGEALRELADQVIETGSPLVDAVSGATETSAGFQEALENALNGRH